MPRYIRNAWVKLNIDGKAKIVETGPKNSNGGLHQTILFREKGSISDARLEIYVRVVTRDGKDYVVCDVDVEGEKVPRENGIRIELER